MSSRKRKCTTWLVKIFLRLSMAGILGWVRMRMCIVLMRRLWSWAIRLRRSTIGVRPNWVNPGQRRRMLDRDSFPSITHQCPVRSRRSFCLKSLIRHWTTVQWWSRRSRCLLPTTRATWTTQERQGLIKTSTTSVASTYSSSRILFWWATITGGISARSGTWRQSSSTTRRTSSTWKTRKYRWRLVHSCGTQGAIW